MKKQRKKKRVALIAMVLFLAFVYLNNSSLLADPPDKRPKLLAHRGLGQTFSMAGITADTCTAKRIHPPEHPYLENTLPSMRAAFEAGADIVEFDIHPTKDGKFAVFHDWTLECRTNGRGVTHDHTMAELKKLDIGYGYTADSGKTYPFRGKGVGLMPSMDEVMKTFPHNQFLIHIKSDDPKEGIWLARYLSKLSPERLNKLAVYGGDQPIAALEKEMPQLRTMSKASMKKCLIPYIALGWSGWVPSACEQTQLHIPEKIGPWLWGWPHRFISRMESVDTRVVIVGGSGEWSSGFDLASDLERLPDRFSGIIWTNRIDRIAPRFPSE